MDFNELQTLWAAQDNALPYVIDQSALQNRIHLKMTSILHVTSVTEWMLILIDLLTGGVLMGFNRAGQNLFLMLAGFWLLATSAYLIFSRIRRVKASRRFDRSVRGDLQHAIFLAGHQMRISQIIRWNFLPLGIILILSGWKSGKLIQVSLFIVLSLVLAFVVTSKGYRLNKKRKQELQILLERLESGL